MDFIKLISCLTILLSMTYGQNILAQDARTLIDQMFASIDQANELSYELRMKERMKNKQWNAAKVYAALQVAPLKLYMKTLEPDLGIEVLYIEGKYNGKALIKPNGFPWMNVKLKPTSSHIMATQHHPFYDNGMKKIQKTLGAAIKKAGKNFDTIFKVTGETTFDGKKCHIMTIESPDFGFTEYTVKKGEDLYKIAEKLSIAEYTILDRNEGIEDYFDVKVGQKLKVPTDYAKKTTIYIDQKDNLPILQKMEDDRGLFEQYEYLKLTTKPKFAKDEFSEKCEKYGF